MTNSDTERLAEVVGRTIARNRIAAGLTQEQVAEQLGIGNEAVSRIERGLVVPNVARLVELANVFDCDIADLLTEVSSRPSDQAKHLARLLAGVSSKDREMIVEIVERLTARFARR
ncbi:helix-turn-helix domain-containing protein [Paraburkholderia graminis]|uniref:Transcriptional regulator with XRE-family HTH domain n=1 Tax=Paraburkholderia graminis TaxID=60548 RepID=A0ABD5CF99_9BURK|nr:helix-turn-helix transcriptional regulator [Paraburkholderia graminis]MDR6202529.1 transcriptional regulator with XRE-family HTH domain [Paraburkholderia graminis]